MLRKRNKGQSVLEYIMLITIILGAFLAIGNYFKRGVQGRWKAAVDDLGDQYDPRTGNTNYRHVLSANTLTRIEAFNTATGTWTTRDDATNSVETKTGYQGVGAY